MMAQGALVSGPTNGVASSLSAAELREKLEYERIVQFRDAILAGIHPRVKIPAHLLVKNGNVPIPDHSTPATNTPAQSTNPAPSSHDSSFYNKSPNLQRTTGNRFPIPSKSEINPILLEKSDDLLKAEILLKRHRLERALREQIEQQRITAKALLQTSESLPNFDLTEVLSKALALVHPSTTVESEPSVGGHSQASDSFDDNTFYSSQHDTPEPSTPSQGRRQSPHGGRTRDSHFAEVSSVPKAVHEDMASALSSHNKLPTAQGFVQSRALDPHSQTDAASIKQRGTDLSGSRDTMKAASSVQNLAKVSRPVDNPPREINPVSKVSHDPLADVLNFQAKEATLRQEGSAMDPPPLVRVHNLSPFAPQPARVSPLATANDPPILREDISGQNAQPAQVSALRSIPAISSTDSSPKEQPRGKKTEKKKEKKRKRKEKEPGGSPESPFIKPEPKSPSPFATAPSPRIHKRQRQSGPYAAELKYDNPRHDQEQHPQERLTNAYIDSRGVANYHFERNGDRYTRVSESGPMHRRIDSGSETYRQVNEGPYLRNADSPNAIVTPHGYSEPRPIRAASQAVERRIYDDSPYYREPVIRATVRPDLDREHSRSPIIMGPPRQAMRVVVDEHGRRYYEPLPAPVMRQSVAPTIRYRDDEVVYTRAVPRTAASRVVEGYEGEGVTTRRGSPSLVAPRRVVTQPEYSLPAQQDYEPYRQREYSVRPASIAPGANEYVQVRGPPAMNRLPLNHFEGQPREYIQRAVSVRPESVRYEMPREYIRMQSVRPEAPPREYAASVRPEGHPEMIRHAQREYSVRPADSLPRQEPSGVPREVRYYDEPPVMAPPRQNRVYVHEDGRYYEDFPTR